jgi:hypothetical protein
MLIAALTVSANRIDRISNLVMWLSTWLNTGLAYIELEWQFTSTPLGHTFDIISPDCDELSMDKIDTR